MNRVYKFQCYIDELLSKIEDKEERMCSYMHLYGTSLSCAMIASKRNLDVELATIAGLLHDIYEYVFYYKLEPLERRSDHGIRNAEFAQKILIQLDLTTEDEVNIICNAIKNHGYKEEIHSNFDEAVKDADVFNKQINNINTPIHPLHEKRFFSLVNEFGLSWHSNVDMWD